MDGEEAEPFLKDSGDDNDDDVYNYSINGRVRSSWAKKSSHRWCSYLVVGVSLLLLLGAIFGAGVLVGHFALPSRVKSSSGGGGGNSSTPSISEQICADPPLLLVSLDGFRNSYFQRNVTPTLKMLYDNGVRAKFMRSSFPTVTFPNHHSIATGLYPESHGIVGNYFYDSKINDTFSMFTRKSLQSKWWGGEPIWVTAAMNKLRTAANSWPGSEALIKKMKPNYVGAYNPEVPFSLRVQTVLDWLDMSKEERPKFIALYSDDPDETGHTYGPESSDVTLMLSEVDAGLSLLTTGLKKRKILDCVNIIVVSDHGMAQHYNNMSMDIQQLIPTALQKSIRYLPLETISILQVPGGEGAVQQVYEGLAAGPAKGMPFRVFRSDQLPLRLHAGLRNKQRYGQIYAIADVHGYMNFSRKNPPLGDHGFDNIATEMQAIFVGHGPYFKKNYTSEGFENIQVYSLMCDLLRIQPSPNNGTYGALHDLLDPDFSSKLGSPHSMTPLPGILERCPFPRDETELVNRSLCEDCVCRRTSCNVSDAEILSTNENLNLSVPLKEFFRRYHHPWGVPQGGSGDGGCELYQEGYVCLYSHTLNTPLWAGYTILPKFNNDNVSSDHWMCLRNDPRLLAPSGSHNCSADLWLEKHNSTYVPSHLLFPMDSNTNLTLSMSLLTNVVYMDRHFRDDIWMLVKSYLRELFGKFHAQMNIVTGVILDANRDGARDPDNSYANKFMGVAIPTHFYVIVTRCAVNDTSLANCLEADLRVLGLVLQHPTPAGDNADPKKVLRNSVTPVRDIERATGIDFFPRLSPAFQNTLELRLHDDLW